MDAGEQLAAEILDTIRLGRDLWVRDQFIEGPDRLERARKVLIEKRDSCSDPDEAAFLTASSAGWNKGDDGDGPRPCEIQFWTKDVRTLSEVTRVGLSRNMSVNLGPRQFR